MKIDLAPETGCFRKNGETIRVCPIILEEHLGIDRVLEPVTVGIPFPLGMVMDASELFLFDERGEHLLLQAQVFSKWVDGSVEWALLDFKATVGAYQKVEYHVEFRDTVIDKILTVPSMLSRKEDILIVNTGKVCFYLNAKNFKPFNQVEIGGVPILSPKKSVLLLTDEKGTTWEPKVQKLQVEADGPVRVTLRAEGQFSLDSSTICDFIGRLSFYRESGVVAIGFTIRNPKAACHPGGLWDLGDKGSIYFQDLSLVLKLQGNKETRIAWKNDPLSGLSYSDGEKVELYQDSSGGKYWKSTNHVNRFGLVKNTFPGYQLKVDDSVVEQGNRAVPVIRWENGTRCVAATVECFWQNFPKALECKHDQMSLRLFPHNYDDLFELQGGEQKTHILYLQFDDVHKECSGLDWAHERLVVHSEPEWYSGTKSIKYLVPRSWDGNIDYLRIIDSAIEGDDTFFDRREVIDEYGWRHFGEVYADHEAVGHQGEFPRISHYNNQYDAINGMMIEFFRTGDHRWYRLMRDLARHVIDIDIYHTKDDRPAYNGGMFWHTDHYFDASTATHRAFSKTNQDPEGVQGYGGGPSNEHNYTSGLLLYYFLTGDYLAYEVVQGLADWVINMDQRRSGFLGFIDRRPRGLASVTTDRDYHGPGRGGGNSINALIDGYQLTKNEKYLLKAEELIRRCIHPQDPIEKRNLGNIEARWSYLVFLQVLGKYLDFKTQGDNLDDMYGYAKASLLHYAEWMVKNEVPYRQVLDRVKIPTETWSAQDIRKSNVFMFAAKYSDSLRRSEFLEKADFFFSSSVGNLQSYPTCRLTRPIILLLVNGYAWAYFQKYPQESAPPTVYDKICEPPRQFSPQLQEIYTVKEWGISFLSRLKSWHRIWRKPKKFE